MSAIPRPGGGKVSSRCLAVCPPSGHPLGRYLAVWSEAHDVFVEDQDVILGFGLPIGLSADLHSVRVVAIGGFDLRLHPHPLRRKARQPGPEE